MLPVNAFPIIVSDTAKRGCGNRDARQIFENLPHNLWIPVFEIGLAAGMTEGRGSCIPIQRYDSNRCAAEAEQVFPSLQQPAVVFRIPTGHILQGEFQHKNLALTGSKFSGLGISAQLPQRLDELAARRGIIELCDLLSGEAAGIADLRLYAYDPVFHLESGAFRLKFCVAQAVAKGEKRLDACRVIIAVAHEHTFPIAGIVALSEIPDGRKIFGPGPSGGELAGRSGFPQQHIGKGVARHAAQLAQKQNIIHLVQHGRNVHRAAHVQHQKKLFILLCTAQNISLFILRQQIVPLASGTIRALAGVAGEHVNTNLAFAVDGDLIAGLRRRTSHADEKDRLAQFLRFPGDIFIKTLDGFIPDGLVAVHPRICGDDDAGILQAFFNADRVAYIHVAASGASLDGLPRARTVQRDLAGSRKWEVSVLFQQHHALRRKRSERL